MATKKETREQKAEAVTARLMEMQGNAKILVGMLDERTLDVLILALGLGHIELN